MVLEQASFYVFLDLGSSAIEKKPYQLLEHNS